MTVEVFARRPDVAVPCGCVLGEGPIWDGRVGTLHWVDINAQALWSWTPGGEAPRSRSLGERTGFVLLTDDPGIVVLGRKSGLARYALADGAAETLVDPEPDLPGNRLNDGVTAPDGSIFFGTLNDAEAEPTGRFYHWRGGGTAERFGAATKTTNGPAIDAERRLLYATDTSRGRVFRHALHDDGSLGEAADFVAFRESDGHPDGMAVDADGHVWICHFRGGRVTRFRPDGSAALVVAMPTPQVTKLAFGGPDLTTIYVTTAARDLDREIDPMAGHLFVFDAGIAGQPAQALAIPGA